MPRQTFWNLPTEKREALAAIALEEFAGRDYASASVSRIVARAGIAKGSLYQYFEDKQDLFLYLVEDAQQTLLRKVQQDRPPGPGSDFFTILRWHMSGTIRAALAYPLQSQLVRRAFTSPSPLQEQLQQQAQTLREGYFRQLIDQAITRGDLSPRLEPETAIFVIDSVLGALGPFLLKKLGLNLAEAAAVAPAQFEAPVVEQTFDEVLEILRRGLAQAED